MKRKVLNDNPILQNEIKWEHERKKNLTLNYDKFTRHSICSANFSLFAHTLLVGMTTPEKSKWNTNLNIPRIIWLHLLYFVCLFLQIFSTFSFNLSLTAFVNLKQRKTMRVIELLLQLQLWGSHLFYVDFGDWVPACIRVSSFFTHALTDPESHADRALTELLADSFNVTWAMWIFLPASAPIH